LFTNQKEKQSKKKLNNFCRVFKKRKTEAKKNGMKNGDVRKRESFRNEF